MKRTACAIVFVTFPRIILLEGGFGFSGINVSYDIDIRVFFHHLLPVYSFPEITYITYCSLEFICLMHPELRVSRG